MGRITPAPPPISFDRDRTFRFVGGDPCLDFVNTGDWTPAGLEHDRFTDYDRLLDWATLGELLPAEMIERFRQVAAAAPKAAAEAVATAWALRHALRRLVLAIVGDTVHDPRVPPLDVALPDVNDYLAGALANRRLVADGAGAGAFAQRWPWEGPMASAAGLPLDAVLWPVVYAAAALLTSSEVPRLRVCGGTDCGWCYVDRSRNGQRRWCEMEVCGTVEKERRRKPRTRA